MPFCSCNDIKLYYEVHGQGFPIVFISGLSGGHWSWKEQVKHFQDDYQCIIFDNRGAGNSSKPKGPYSIEQMALDTVHLLYSLQVMEFCAVGISMGGMIAQELALILPHRIRALVLCSTHPGGDLHISTPPDIYQKLTSNEGLSQEEIVEKNIPLLFSRYTQTNHPEVLDLYRQGQKEIPKQPLQAFKAQQEAIQGFDCSKRLFNIKRPTLVMTGQDDILIPPENSHLIAERIPQATVQEIPKAGHAIHIEQTETFNQNIQSFLEQQAFTRQ